MMLLDYCEINNSKVLKFEGNKKYIATGDVIDNEIKSFRSVTFEDKPSRANLVLSDNEVLFAKMKNTIKVLLGDKNNSENIYSTGFYCLKPNEKVLPKLLYYYLNSIQFNKQKDLHCKGATMKAINDDGLKKIMVTFPSIDKQQEIVEYLDNLTVSIENRKQVFEDYDRLIYSKYIELFGTSDDSKYPVYKLSQLTTKITDGVHSKPNYTDSGIPFISVKDMTTGKLILDDCKYVSKAAALIYNKRCNPEIDDILYSKVGATYGRSAIVDTNELFSLYVSVALIKPNKDLINPLFLNYTLRQPYVKKQADKRIKGIGVPDLHLVEIKDFDIVLPPFELQEEFSKFVNEIDVVKNKCTEDIKDLENLFKSKLKEIFS